MKPLPMIVLWVALAATATVAPAESLGAGVRQLILSTAPDWTSTQGSLQRFERRADGQWTKVGGPVAVLYGKQGLAWGRGVLGRDEPGVRKREGDGRTPAGAFEI